MERDAGGLRHAPPGACAVAHRQRGQLDRRSDDQVDESGKLNDLLDADGLAQAAAVRDGQVSARELVDAAIARIEAENPALNAVIHPLFEKARAEVAADAPRDANAPFAGVPFLVKDAVCHTAGDPYHLGMRALKTAGYVADSDSELARRFRRAGFVFVGKTNTPELALSVTTEPLAYGATRNPWKLGHSTGGSSGGSAAAVAARWVAAAHANDMGGSIRVPAAHCGLVGLKPTRGRSTLAPGFGEFWGPLTHEHVVTRSVRDSAAILDAIHGPAPGDPYPAAPPTRPFLDAVGAPPGRLRVGRLETPSGVSVDSAVDAAVDAVGEALVEEGHAVEPVAIPRFGESNSGPWIGAAVARDLDRWSERIGRRIEEAEVEPFNWLLAQGGRALDAPSYVKQAEEAWSWAREICTAWEGRFDLLLMPTTPTPAPELGFLAPTVPLSELAPRMLHGTAFTMPFDVTGQPAISLPTHLHPSGLPIGVQLVAPFGDEATLFRLASQLEPSFDWLGRRPPAVASAS